MCWGNLNVSSVLIAFGRARGPLFVDQKTHLNSLALGQLVTLLLQLSNIGFLFSLGALQKLQFLPQSLNLSLEIRLCLLRFLRQPTSLLIQLFT